MDKIISICGKFGKCIFSIYNVILLVVGIACVAGIAIGKNKIDAIAKYMSDVNSVVNILLALGILFLIVAIVGCYGICAKHKIVMMVVFVILLITTLLSFILSGLGPKICNEAVDNLAEMIQKDFDKYKKGEDNSDIHSQQKGGECCGVHGPSFYTDKGLNIPMSCCGEEVPTGTDVACTAPYKVGCADSQTKFIKDMGHLVKISFISMGLILIFDAFCAAMIVLSIIRAPATQEV